ncbi:hypothetical protein B0H10DRAFT_2189063 [Mycena sp. CBHHK59/15]|nr:hypothetical protein B0H10DRAFT_2189063 [Mycena sp. CBHHK59/15]
MSILVNGVHTSRVLTSTVSPVTVLSSDFVRSRFPLWPSSRFALTVNGGPHGSFTTELACFISPHLSVDICLGLDWKAMMREWLIGLGQPPALYQSYLHARDPSDVSGCITPFLSLVNLSATSTRGPDVSLRPGSDVSASPSPSCYTRSSTASIPASMIAGPDHCVSRPNLTAYAHTTHSNAYAHSPAFAPVHNTTTNMLAHHCNSVPVTSGVIQGTSSNGFGPPWSFLFWSDSFRGLRGPGFPFDDWYCTSIISLNRQSDPGAV